MGIETCRWSRWVGTRSATKAAISPSGSWHSATTRSTGIAAAARRGKWQASRRLNSQPRTGRSAAGLAGNLSDSMQGRPRRVMHDLTKGDLAAPIVVVGWNQPDASARGCGGIPEDGFDLRTGGLIVMAWLGNAIHVFTANSKKRRGWPGQARP